MKQTNPIRKFKLLLWGTLLILGWPVDGMSLDPAEILIVANRQACEGVELARYYANKRGISPTHLLLLNLPFKETCSRAVYEREIAAPVRDYLAAIQPSGRVRCIVLIYGVPLRVKPVKKAETKDVSEFKNKLNHLKITRDRVASVDSELSVVKVENAPVGGWIENPFYIGFRNQPEAVPRQNVLMVSRLDGPTAASVRRIIDDTIATEKQGLVGSAYFDARWSIDPSAKLSGYKLYDMSIHKAAEQVQKNRNLPVHLNASAALFQPGQCPDAALYCGWYSLAKYVDAFNWQKGAIGYHIASSECTTLKKENSQVWCKRMIEEGVCATVGPVGEPYVQAFPMPEVFFGFLSEGILSLAECYMVSLPFLSWKMVLIGDPLYHPFAAQSSN